MPRTAFGGTSDNTRVDKRYYERPSIPQSTPLLTIELDLPRDQFQTEFWPALEQSLRSFRASEIDRVLAEKGYRRTDFPQSAPLLTIQLDLPRDQFQTEFWAALAQLSNSFRTDEIDRILREYRRTDFPQSAPLLTIPLDLSRDLFQTEFWPALSQLSNSFRSEQQYQDTHKHGRSDFPQSTPVFTFALGFTDVFQTEFWPAFEQSRNSFRTRELIAPVYLYYISKRSTAVIFLEPKHTVPPIEQLHSSFHSGFLRRIQELSRGNLPQTPFIPDLFQPELWPVFEQSRSFRTDESARILGEYRRTDFPQSAPLLTIQLDLPRDLAQPEFWPALAQLSRSFRTDEIDRILREYRRTDFPQFAPLLTIPISLTDLFQPQLWPAIEQLQGFRTDEIDRILREYRRTDFPQSAPLLTIPLDLPRDLFQTAFWSALEQLRSFRTDEIDRVLREYRRTDFAQSAPLFAIEVGTADLGRVEFFPACDQLLRGFRIRENKSALPRLQLELINTIQDGWLQAASVVPGGGGLGSSQYRDTRRR